MIDFSDQAQRLDRDGDAPLWAQLETELRRRMEAGHFTDRFPTDRELMEVYEVSRHTARHAVSQLGADGIVRRARGVGTSVDRRRFERSLGNLYSLFQVVEEAGVEQHSEVRGLERVTDPVAAGHLELDPATELVLIDRVRFAGPDPVAIDRIWLPAEIAEPLLDADFTRTSLYNEMDASIGRHPTEGWERISPKIPTAEERDVLGLDDGEALFSIERVGICGGTPSEWRVTVIRGSKIAFVADWTAGQRSELRIEMATDPTGGQ